jgi:flagellar biosynthesis component FlhA
VVLCSPIARFWVKEFTRMKFPNLAVLSYIEIPSDITVEPIGEIALEDQGALKDQSLLKDKGLGS